MVFGVVTHICVRSSVHEAFSIGYDVATLHDCRAATGPREQDNTLYDVATHFGVVSDVASVVRALRFGVPLSPPAA